MSSSSSKAKPSPNPKSPTPKPSPMATSSTPKRKRIPRDLDDDDNVTILNAVASFRSSHGGVVPTRTTMAPVFDAVKESLHRPLTIDQLYNKFRTLKHKFYRSGPGNDPAFFDLSVKAWGKKNRRKSAAADVDADDNEEELEEEENDAAAGDCCKCLSDQVTECWREKGMSMAALEMGLKAMDKTKAKALEEEWREYFEEEMRIRVKAMEVTGEVLRALVDRRV